MYISDYIGIDYNIEYTTDELNNMLSKFNNLDMENYYMDEKIIFLLESTHISSIIKFIDIFQDINKFEDGCEQKYSLVGNIICMITRTKIHNEICVYKIMDHLLKRNMNTLMCHITELEDGGNKKTYGIEHYHYNDYAIKNNYYVVQYMINNHNVIQNVRKIINNYDIILFNITNDLSFIESLLLVTKCKNKIVPKFVITHKILYYYLLDRNIEYNKDDSIN